MVRIKRKNAFSAVLDVTIVFYALFYPRTKIFGVGSQGVRSQWDERGKFWEVSGRSGNFSLFGSRGEGVVMRET